MKRKNTLVLVHFIAWSDEEYIDWGIKLGKDENLRRKVIAKLDESRQTSPLWNARQFTKYVESAYRQMWQIYCERITFDDYIL